MLCKQTPAERDIPLSMLQNNLDSVETKANEVIEDISVRMAHELGVHLRFFKFIFLKDEMKSDKLSVNILAFLC